MTVAVGWLDPSQDCWDTNMLRRLLDGDLYPHGLQVRHYSGYPTNVDGCCLVIPSRYWHDHTDQISQAIGIYNWVLAFRVGDEEDLFDITKVGHPQLKWWVQTPRGDRDYGDARLFGVGFPPHFNDLPAEPPEKLGDVYLSGQRTHKRREECFAALEPLKNGRNINATGAFTQGAPPNIYAQHMCHAKVAPCPSGAVSPDSFRFWEALEAHSIPIADTVSPVDGDTDYWGRVCPGAPFPIIRDYADLPGYIEDALKDWPASVNRITAWWMARKRQYAKDLVGDLQALGAL